MPEPPTMGGLCLMVGTLAAVGVGWTAACVAQPELLGTESLLTTGCSSRCSGRLLWRRGPADDLARMRIGRAGPAAVRPPAGSSLPARGAGPAGAERLPARGLALPGVGYSDLGAAAPLLWEGLLVALAECARIADGMDGIVCGASFAAMLGLMGR